MLTADVLAFVRAALPLAPARLLEVGAGDGELADALRGAGYDVVAIDPASRAPGVRAVALNELDEAAEAFDGAVAVVSLHHVEPLAASFETLAAVIRPGGLLVVDEFDVDRLDEAAARWWLAQRRAAGHEPHGAPAELVADMRRHIHALRAVTDALAPWFRCGSPVRGPYMHRWQLPPGLRDAEEHAIAAGRLPATGARLVCERRPAGPARR